jgi:hypothetical protein
MSEDQSLFKCLLFEGLKDYNGGGVSEEEFMLIIHCCPTVRDSRC